MGFCEKCGELLFWRHGANTGECNCQPFTVVDEDGEEHKVNARSSEDAALKYAEKSNENGDYYLMDNTVEITVNGELFRIGAEMDIHYSVEAL
jgi:DNA-directed RNA polymerase subunit M/transcription elongation factor TFIIS